MQRISTLCIFCSHVYHHHINAGQAHNFVKHGSYAIDSLGVPYDYGSIIHYGKHEFAKLPWLAAVRPKKPGVKIGQLKGLSPLDVKQVNLLYNCNKI